METTMSGWLPPQLATLLASFVAAFLGSAIVALAALIRFKRERAFDRKVEWLEKIVVVLHQLAYDLHVAATVQREDYPQELKRKLWNDLQKREREFHVIAAQAPLYAYDKVADTVASLSLWVVDVSRLSYGFEVRRARPEDLPKMHVLADDLRSAARPLAEIGRYTLGIGKRPPKAALLI